MMLWRVLFVSVALWLLVPIGASAHELRTWTDKTGRLQVEAELLSVRPGKVRLRRVDGQTVEVPLAELSRADQQYVRDLVRRQQAEVPTDSSDSPEHVGYGSPRRLGELADARIRESSGLACSRRHAGLFWTHNDSGGEARIYLFDSQGRDLGSCVLRARRGLRGILAYDWEDIASFEADGKPYLLVGDVGNNGLAAAVQMLHLVEEPAVDPDEGLQVDQVAVERTIFFSYEDDHRDCEAVAVDPTDKTILLVTKEYGIECRVYALAWPDEDGEKAHVARSIGMLKIPTVTAMDVSPDGRRAVVSTYWNAYEYVRGEDEDWPAAFARRPRQVRLPLRIQGESICYGPDGKTLYLTSEKRPTPLWEVPVAVDGG